MAAPGSVRDLVAGAGDGVFHAAIAGMTGSGKSTVIREYLDTLVQHAGVKLVVVYTNDVDTATAAYGSVAACSRFFRYRDNTHLQQLFDARTAAKERREPLPVTAIVFDDIFDGSGNRHVDDLFTRARNLGVFLVLASQTSNRTLSPVIRRNSRFILFGRGADPEVFRKEFILAGTWSCMKKDAFDRWVGVNVLRPDYTFAAYDRLTCVLKPVKAGISGSSKAAASVAPAAAAGGGGVVSAPAAAPAAPVAAPAEASGDNPAGGGQAAAPATAASAPQLRVRKAFVPRPDADAIWAFNASKAEFFKNTFAYLAEAAEPLLGVKTELEVVERGGEKLFLMPEAMLDQCVLLADAVTCTFQPDGALNEEPAGEPPIVELAVGSSASSEDGEGSSSSSGEEEDDGSSSSSSSSSSSEEGAGEVNE